MTAHVTIAKDEERTLPIRDHDGLRSALLEANYHTMLMVYVQLSHDEAMLDRFAPFISSPYSMNPVAPPEDLQADLRGRLFDLLTQSPALEAQPLSHALMQKMMSINVAENVDEEYIPLLLEQMGFELPTPRSEKPERVAPPAGFKVLVIGAGMTGLVAAIKLAEAGYEHVVIEKNSDVGGTWFENVYPGVGVDTPSHFYSFSFEIYPEWNHYNPKGRDMQAYLLRVADKYKIRDRAIFNSKVVACIYNDETAIWDVTVRHKDGTETVHQANAIINGHGPINRWKLPKIPGLETFKGPKMHTAAWDNSVDLKGKDIVQIGTGASGVQLSPAIAPSAKHLTIFQRSRHWTLRNPEIGKAVPEGVKFALRHIPGYKEWFRYRVYWFAGDGLFANVVKDRSWNNQEESVSALNDGMRQFALGNLKQAFADRPDLFEKLVPDHPIFSKRITLDDGWWDCLKRDNVSFETRKIDHIVEDGVVLEDGAHVHADVLALATGFNLSKMQGDINIVGAKGASLDEMWGDEDPRSLLGITVPGFPNYFHTVGPNSAPNHAAGQNLVSETQINYIVECLDAVVAAGGKAIEPTREAFDAWNEQIDKRMEDMIWTHPKAESYYNNSKRRVYLSWPYRLVDYWNETRKPDLSQFTIHN